MWIVTQRRDFLSRSGQLSSHCNRFATSAPLAWGSGPALAPLGSVLSQSKSVGVSADGGGTRPRCSQPARVATRPRGVRASRPCLTRNGSATTSTVSASSPTATARVDRPTGPPPNRLISASRTARSRRSRPSSSTSYSSSAVLVSSLVTRPSARTSA